MKIIKWSLIILTGINVIAVLTGVVFPMIVSTNKVPLSVILLGVTAIVFCLMSIVSCFFSVKTIKKAEGKNEKK